METKHTKQHTYDSPVPLPRCPACGDILNAADRCGTCEQAHDTAEELQELADSVLLSLDMDATEYDAAVDAKEARAVAKYGPAGEGTTSHPRRPRGPMPYQVEIADKCGVFGSRRAWTFEKIVELGIELRRESYIGRHAAVLSFANLDCADIDTDGLTEDETERLP